MQEKVSISFFASIGGVVVTLLTAAVMHAIWGLDLAGLGWAGRTLCLTLLLVFQIGGVVVGISERGSNCGRIGLLLSIIFIIAIVTGFILFIWHGLILVLIPAPAILMGVFAGVTAIRLQRKPSLKVWKALMILWITPSVWCAVLISIPAIIGIFKSGCDYEQLLRSGTGIVSILFGPWATLAAKIVDWPNAGEFFSLPAAVILTIILMGLAAAAMGIRNCAIRGIAVIGFASFILIWAIVGIGQLLNCAE
jgi:hypothetical protein